MAPPEPMLGGMICNLVALALVVGHGNRLLQFHAVAGANHLKLRGTCRMTHTHDARVSRKARFCTIASDAAGYPLYRKTYKQSSEAIFKVSADFYDLIRGRAYQDVN